MQNQIPDKVSSSEEIYNKIIRDTFDVPEIYTSQEEDSFSGKGFSMQIGRDSDSKDNFIVHKIVNTLTSQLLDFLPGAFKITPLPEQCRSYANL